MKYNFDEVIERRGTDSTYETTYNTFKCVYVFF